MLSFYSKTHCWTHYIVAFSLGADVNRTTRNNEHSVLSLACVCGHISVVELLLCQGADPTHKVSFRIVFTVCVCADVRWISDMTSFFRKLLIILFSVFVRRSWRTAPRCCWKQRKVATRQSCNFSSIFPTISSLYLLKTPRYVFCKYLRMCVIKQLPCFLF